MYVALYEVEGLRKGVERFEGKREVAIVDFAYVLILRSKGIYFSIIINIELDAIGCCQLISLTISLKVGVFGNAEPVYDVVPGVRLALVLFSSFISKPMPFFVLTLIFCLSSVSSMSSSPLSAAEVYHSAPRPS